ncbi:MAG TPA: hypothetical protein VEA61_14045 [Allosphingosinicella sp.]|nr:hypothetical protein [Allosphingosinicella sp.]
MESSEQERLALVQQAFNAAFQRRAADLKQAATDEQAEEVLRNIARLERAYLAAAEQALDRTGPQIEAAYQAARDAKRSVDEAYASAKSMAERIARVGDLAGKIGDLVAKAGGKA